MSPRPKANFAPRRCAHGESSRRESACGQGRESGAADHRQMTRLDLPPLLPPFRPCVPDQDVAGRYGFAWRGPGEFYARLIIDDLESLGASPAPTVLDIGCGGGLLGARIWQREIATRAGCYIGVEPDTAAEPAPVFTRVQPHTFEEAPIEAGSVDLAYAAMVIEHVRQPASFFAKLADVLRPGGCSGHSR